MRVLFVCPCVPWPLDSGGRIRSFRLLEQAARRVELSLWCVAEPRPLDEARERLRGLGLELEIFPRSHPDPLARLSQPKIERWFASKALDQALRTRAGAFDLVHLDELLLARRLPAQAARAVLVHHHKLDLEFQRLIRPPTTPAAAFDLAKLARLEALAAGRFDNHLTCSPLDSAILAARYPNLRIEDLPSGFDPGEFTPSVPAPTRDPERLVFVGSLDYEPNIDGLEWFVKQVLPRLRERHPRLHLDVVGRAPGPRIQALAGSSVRIVGPVETVKPALESAALTIVPLRMGGGTRLKLVEALALASPLVSTPVGAEGLAFEAGQHLAIAETAEAFGACILELLGDPIRAQAMGQAGSERARQLYPWPHLGDRLVDLWRRLAAQAPTGPRQP